MSAIGLKPLHSVAHTEASKKGDTTSNENLNLAWRCYWRVKAVPGTDHENWFVCMERLWQLGGIAKGGPDRGLEWDWVARSYKKLAAKLHPDNINNVLFNRKALSGLWTQVQQKYEECRWELLGGPARVAAITGAEAVRGTQPTGPCIYESCHAVDTDIHPDADTDMRGQTTVRLYFPGGMGNKAARCVPMNVANGSAHATLGEGDYPWLFHGDMQLMLQRTNQFNGVQERYPRKNNAVDIGFRSFNSSGPRRLIILRRSAS